MNASMDSLPFGKLQLTTLRSAFCLRLFAQLMTISILAGCVSLSETDEELGTTTNALESNNAWKLVLYMGSNAWMTHPLQENVNTIALDHTKTTACPVVQATPQNTIADYLNGSFSGYSYFTTPNDASAFHTMGHPYVHKLTDTNERLLDNGTFGSANNPDASVASRITGAANGWMAEQSRFRGWLTYRNTQGNTVGCSLVEAGAGTAGHYVTQCLASSASCYTETVNCSAPSNENNHCDYWEPAPPYTYTTRCLFKGDTGLTTEAKIGRLGAPTGYAYLYNMNTDGQQPQKDSFGVSCILDNSKMHIEADYNN